MARGALVVAFVLLIVVAFFGPTTLGGHFLIMHDAWCWSFPLRSMAWAQMHAGHLPLWTSGIFSGYPLLSMSQLGFGYPGTWLYALNPAWGEQAYVLLPFALCPIFTYVFVRELGRSVVASLLAALSFGYGGFMASPITHNGMLSNGFMWTPLVLCGIERARSGNFARCLVGTSVSYGLAVVSGVGQGFLSAGIVALAYGVFVTATQAAPAGWRNWQRLRPLTVALAGIALGAGLGAFQILETAQANQLSVRKKLTYALFTQGSASIGDVVRSIFLPLHTQIGDVTSFVAPLVLVLAAVAVGARFRRGAARDPVISFWLGMAGVAFVLMCGSSTPLYHFAHLVPLLNLFRIPPRHAAEWTLALAVLAAYGWDHAALWLRTRRPLGERTAHVWIGVLLLALAAAVTWGWNGLGTAPSTGSYALYKLAATLALIAAGAYAALLAGERARVLLSVCVVALGTVSESYLCLSRWWFPNAKTEADLMRVAPITAYLAQLPAKDQRVYTHIIPFGEESSPARPADVPNITALHGIDDVAGYDPMIFERYSEALGGAGMFALPIGWNVLPDSDYAGPFNLRSRVLDILNVKYVVRRLAPKEPVVPPDWQTREVLDRLVMDIGRPEVRHFLKTGFREDSQLAGRMGAWTDGSRAVVKAFILGQEQRYVLRLTAIAYRDSAPVNLGIYLNGKRIARKQMPAEWKQVAVKVPEEAMAEGWNEITLVAAKHRTLDLFLNALSLTPADEDPGDGS